MDVGVVVIGAGNGIAVPRSNSDRVRCDPFRTNTLGKGSNPPLSPSVMS